MIKFCVSRFIWLLLTLWVVFTISFFLMKAVPGSPLTRDRQMPPEIRRNIEARFNLDKPLMTQYWTELANVARGDLGYSFKLGDFSVNEVIAQGLPVSMALGVLAMTFALTLGLSAGIVSAVWRGSAGDFTLMALATVGIAVPNFVLAGVLIILFVFVVPIFPAAGWGSLRQLILPAFCLGAPYAAYIARLSRTGMLDVMNQDFIRTAYAKGLSRRRVILVHALRSAMLPVVSFLGPAVAGILTGSPVVEQIFALPGLGMHFVEAALQRDYTLAMGLVLLFTTLLYTMNFLVDLSYKFLDPRVELE